MSIIKYLELHPQLSTLFSVLIGGILTFSGVYWQQKQNKKTITLEFIDNTKVAYEVLAEEINKTYELIDNCFKSYNIFLKFQIDPDEFEKFEETDEFYNNSHSEEERKELEKNGQQLKATREQIRSNNKSILQMHKNQFNENLSVTKRSGNYLHNYILLALPSEKLNLFKIQMELEKIMNELNKILIIDYKSLKEYLNADYQNTFKKRIEVLKKETSKQYKIFLSRKVPK